MAHSDINQRCGAPYSISGRISDLAGVSYFFVVYGFGADTGIQAWRFAGLGFLALYAHGVLPGVFAWPAGVGDIAIGLTAPWMALRLTRKPASVSSGLFVVWNLLGILDLIIAVGMGAVGAAFAAGISGEITTSPMARLPLVLIPAYFVPLFVMLHFAALFQARRQVEGRSGRVCAVTAR